MCVVISIRYMVTAVSEATMGNDDSVQLFKSPFVGKLFSENSAC